MIRVYSLALLALLAGVSAAQEAGTDDLVSSAGKDLDAQATAVITPLLASRNLDRVAWGAFLAEKHQARDAIHDLRGVLGRLKRTGNPRIDIVLHFVLDALIGLRARVDPNEVMPLFESFPNEVLILLAESPGANRKALVRVLERYRHRNQWIAAANLLVTTRSADFAAHLMQGMPIRIAVTVCDREGDVTFASSGIGEGGISGSTYHYPKALPAVPYYTLTTKPRRGAVVLAPGHTTVFRERHVVRKLPPERTSRGDFVHARCAYLAQLLGVKSGELAFSPRPRVRVRFEGLAALRARVAELRREAAATYRALADRLVTANLIDASTATTLEPVITVQLVDKRSDKTPPLPENDF